MAGGIAAAAAVPARAATVGPDTAATAAAQQPLLREGSRGAAVSDWQATLNKLAGPGEDRRGRHLRAEDQGG